MPDSIATAASRRISPALRVTALLLGLGGLTAPNGPAARAATAEPRVAVGGAVSAAALAKLAQPLGRQPANTHVSLALALPLRNQSALQTLLGRLYNRNDSLYGKYLTPGQFNQQFAPTQADYDVVVRFAKSQGLSVEPHAGRTLVVASGPSATVEKAFGVHLNQYRMATGRVAYANDVAPTVPASVASRLTGVIGLNNLVIPTRQSHLLPGIALDAVRSLATDLVGTDASGGLTPTDIRNVYNLNLSSINNLAGEGQRVALVEPGGNYSLGDIGAYVSHFNLPTNAGAIQTRYVNGASASTSVDPLGEAEAALDIDMVLALAPRIKFVFPYVAPTLDNVNIIDVEAQVAEDDAAQIVSISLGGSETGLLLADYFRDYQSIFTVQEQIYERMAAQGQSVFVSSGDAGAYTDGVNLSVSYQSSAPTVTGVGGTTLSTTTTGVGTSARVTYGGETAWGNATDTAESPKGSGSGGGISFFWQKPSYQYKDSANKIGALGEGGLLAPAMRDVPDVALNADPASGYSIYVGDQTPTGTADNFLVVGGTSAAAPLWAAFTALVNEGRALSGSAPTAGVDPGTPSNPIGFINPLVYAIGNGQYGSYANDFHDVHTGTNLFYPATTGYDDATGWGSFNGANLLRDMVAAVSSSGTGGGTGGSGSGGSGSGGGTTTGSTGTITGTVTLNGNSASGVTITVQAVSSDGTVNQSTTTTTGSFSLAVPAGLTYTVSANANGYYGQSYTDISLTTSGATETFNLTSASSATTFSAGLQMISAPFDFSSTGLDFAGLFGLATPLTSSSPRLILWQAALNQYVYYPTAPADTLRPGIGYWINVPSGGAYLHQQGTAVTAPFTVALQAGWNQIGDPFTAAEPLSSITVSTTGVVTGGQALPQSSLVSPTLYTYPANNGSYVTETSALQPYLGYWVYAKQAVYLIFD